MDASVHFTTPQDIDPYSILGVEPSASADVIRRTYKHLALRYHPDRTTASLARHHQAADPSSFSSDTALPVTNAATFQAIVAAYALLKDPASRQSYDQKRWAWRYAQQLRPSSYRSATASPQLPYHRPPQQQQQQQHSHEAGVIPIQQAEFKPLAPRSLPIRSTRSGGPLYYTASTAARAVVEPYATSAPTASNRFKVAAGLRSASSSPYRRPESSHHPRSHPTHHAGPVHNTESMAPPTTRRRASTLSGPIHVTSTMMEKTRNSASEADIGGGPTPPNESNVDDRLHESTMSASGPSPASVGSVWRVPFEGKIVEVPKVAAPSKRKTV